MNEGLEQERELLSVLSYVFSREPTREFLENIGRIEIPREEDELDRGLNLMGRTVKNQAHRMDDYVEELAIAFAELFIGPRNPPAVPYVSVYLSRGGTLMSDVTLEVRKRYLETGLVVKNLYSVPDDHIAIELEFAAYLTGRGIETGENEGTDQNTTFLRMKEDFVREHMSRWVPAFTEQVLNHGREDFYRGAALALRGYVAAYTDNDQVMGSPAAELTVSA